MSLFGSGDGAVGLEAPYSFSLVMLFPVFVGEAVGNGAGLSGSPAALRSMTSLPVVATDGGGVDTGIAGDSELTGVAVCGVRLMGLSLTAVPSPCRQVMTNLVGRGCASMRLLD